MARCPRCFMVQGEADRCVSCGAPLAPSAAPVDENPYAAPRVGIGAVAISPVLDQILATRLARLGAQIIDLMINAVVCIPGFLIFVLATDGGRNQNSPNEDLVAFLGLLLLLAGLLAFNIYQWILLTRDGQTVGKKALAIRIVRYDNGGPAGFGRAVGLRVWVNWLISQIPCLGIVYPLVDVFFIFGDERRCVHDYIAGTKVIAD